MTRPLRIFLLAGLLVFIAGQASADISKLDPRARIAVTLLRGGTPVPELRANAQAVSETGDLDVFIQGSVSREELEALGVQVRTTLPRLYTAYVPVDVIDQVAALSDVTSIHGATECLPNLNTSVPTTGASLLRGAGPAFAGVNGAGVLVGDVDSGIYFAHGDFKDNSGLTRIINIWDQTVSTVNPPSGYTYGREWSKAEIDGGTCTETDGGGAITSGYGHGTHVMGIAAGDGSQTGGTYGVPAYTYVGMAPMADIIMVKTTMYDTAILDGVAYFFGRATARGQNAACNLSLGGQSGPHDGTSAFEAGLTALTGSGRIICVAAGNDRGTGASGYPYIHARLFAALTGDSAKMLVSGASSNPPAGSAASVAIDGYYEAADNVNVTLRAPNGQIIGPITLGTSNAAYPGAVYTGVGRVYVENGIYTTSTGKKEIYFEMSRTSSTNTPNGTWTFLFAPVSLGGGGRVDMWRYYTYTSTIANATQFTLKNTNENTVSEPANAAGVITVGGWETKNGWTDCGGRSVSYTSAPVVGALNTFSAQGPSVDGRQKPDITAPGMGVGSTRSFDATGTCGTSASSLLNDGSNHVINQGTSMAAPHATGASALLMQKYGALTPAQIRTYLASNATVDSYTGTVPNYDWGSGKLHLGDLLDPTVTVTNPNGGESFITTSPQTLTWTATDNVGVSSVDVLLSRSGTGGPFETLYSGPNSNSYSWTVTGPPSNDCYLKVVAHDEAGNAGSDLSNLPFAIIDIATPTLLSEFAANPVEAGIELRWRFGQPEQFGPATVERALAADGPWVIAAVERRTEEGTSIALDRNVEGGRSYWYRITATSGTAPYTFGPIEARAGEVIREFALSRPVPNPTSSSMRVDYAVPREARVDLSVFDMQGRRVTTLVEGLAHAGRNQAIWNGTAGSGPVAAGVYFVRLRAPGVNLTRRLVIAR
jgi:hypothetical protein